MCRQAECKNRCGRLDSYQVGGIAPCTTCGLKLKTQLCTDAHISHCASFRQCPICSACVAKRSMSSHKDSKTLCVVCSQYFDNGKSHLHRCFIQPPIRRKRPNTDYDNESKKHQELARKTKKMDEESSPLPDIDRDTEQAVQDNAIWVFVIGTDKVASRTKVIRMFCYAQKH